ncbi:MAG: hypothetical protein JST55_07135 [Bacteroidetes bacterium]|nr:hypothetical protein [Bacteroidota bacterium]
MIESVSIKILKSFNPEEINDFNDFLNSPYFNKSGTVIKLWDVIKQYAPLYDNPDLKKENLFRIVFRKKEYNYGTMKNLMHSFTTLLERFLELKFHEDDKFQNDYNSLVYCIVKYYPELFNRKFTKIMKDYNDVKEGVDLHYLFRYLIMRLGSSFGGLNDKLNYNIFKQGESLIYFFLIHFFQVHHNISVLKNRQNYILKDNLMENFLNALDIKKLMGSIKKKNPKDFQVVNLYYHIYLCRNEPENEDYFLALKNLIFNSVDILHEFEQEYVLHTLHNILHIRTDSGIFGAVKETAEYYKFILKRGLDIGNTESKINFNLFCTAVKYLFEAKDKKTALKFYTAYIDKTIIEDKDNIENFYHAYSSFAIRNFNKALEYSANIQPKIEKNKLSIKELQIRCYYELNEPDAFKYTLDSYRHLLYRNTAVSENVKTFNKNFLNILNSLFEYKVSQKGNLNDIELETKKMKMVNKEWILFKLEELNKNKK